MADIDARFARIAKMQREEEEQWARNRAALEQPLPQGTLTVKQGSDNKWRVQTVYGDNVGVGATREEAIANIEVAYRGYTIR